MDRLTLHQILSHFAKIIVETQSQAMADLAHFTDHRIVKGCAGTLSKLRP